MSAHMRKLPINKHTDFVRIQNGGVIYQFPRKIAERYRVVEQSVSPDVVFADINKKYTRPGALLRGVRLRESLTQAEMAKQIRVTQSDISQMENGTRHIGRKIAKRIEKKFDINYRSFLE